MINISFLDTKNITFNKTVLKNQIKELIKHEGYTPKDISLVFCSDNYLLEVNQKYLNHDYYTDIITFDYSDFPHISGDLLISADMLLENASKNNVVLLHELSRVVFHGVLHLCGFKDKKKADKELMTQKEDFYLSYFSVSRSAV